MGEPITVPGPIQTKPKALIMRGPAGCGKSHYVRRYAERLSLTPTILSADFFLDRTAGPVDNVMRGRAHQTCFRNWIEALIRREPVVICDNTNIRMWELAPYYKSAESFGYDPLIVWFLCDPRRQFREGLHGVPRQKMYQMACSIEPVPDFWNVSFEVSRYSGMDEKTPEKVVA
jgi:hypothetical protein